MRGKRQAVAQLLRGGDVVAAQRPLEIITKDEAPDVRVDAIRAYKDVASLRCSRR